MANKKYAIIQTGGKQYRVAEGDIIDVELLGSAEEGSQVELGEVLIAFDGDNTQIGQPTIDNFFVYGEVIGTVKGPKITSVKYKPSHNQVRKWGHRQHYTRLKITDIGNKRKRKEGKHGA